MGTRVAAAWFECVTMVANAHSFQINWGLKSLEDWLADQQETSLVATGPQSSHITPSSQKDRLLAFPLTPRASSERHKWGEWIRELGEQRRSSTKQRIPSRKQSLGIECVAHLVSGPEGFCYRGQDRHHRGNERIVRQDEKTLEHVGVGWTWGLRGDRGGLTQECTVHNLLIQICKKIAF